MIGQSELCTLCRTEMLIARIARTQLSPSPIMPQPASSGSRIQPTKGTTHSRRGLADIPCLRGVSPWIISTTRICRAANRRPPIQETWRSVWHDLWKHFGLPNVNTGGATRIPWGTLYFRRRCCNALPRLNSHVVTTL